MEFLVEKLEAEAGAVVELTDVLMYADGETVSIGQPRLHVCVHCICVGHEKGPKLRTIKYRRHKNYKRHYGHRQLYTRLRMDRLEQKGN
jgi:large subunit ribosomal protein L21